jgi:hypothetical protein
MTLLSTFQILKKFHVKKEKIFAEDMRQVYKTVLSTDIRMLQTFPHVPYVYFHTIDSACENILSVIFFLYIPCSD